MRNVPRSKLNTGRRKPTGYTGGRSFAEPLEVRMLLTAIVVGTTQDGNNIPTVSLRDAVTMANASTTPTTITFDPTVFAATQTIMLNGSLTLNPNQPVTINGPAAGVTLDGRGFSLPLTISSSTVTISNLHIVNGYHDGISNSATLYLQNSSISSTIFGPGLLSGSTAYLDHVTLSNNDNSNDLGFGGGIRCSGTTSITNSTITGNTASGRGGSGAGIDAGNGFLTLSNVVISNNIAKSDGGGLYNLGEATITNTTFSGNASGNGGGVPAYGGGAINNAAGIMYLLDSTLAQNTATVSGGAIFDGGASSTGPAGTFNSATITVTNCTVANNMTTGSFGGALFGAKNYTVTTSNDVFSGNLYATTSEEDVGGFDANGNNFYGPGAGSNLALLMPLGNYGGFTQTMPPMPNSPLIDAGSNALAVDANGNPLTLDQRGSARVFNGKVDIGAVELPELRGTSGNDTWTLTQDADHQHIDYALNGSTGKMSIADALGLTFTSNGGADAITLVGAGALPNAVHLNGSFTLNGFTGANPLANTKLDISSTLLIPYAGPATDPLSNIRGYLKNGYNAGLWNGIPTATTGVITSSAAASNPNKNTGIGYADSADGLVSLPANTIELKYTLYGDTGLTGSVAFTDFMRMTQHYTLTGQSWSKGDFSYDGTVDGNDFNLLQPNFGQTLPAPLPAPAMTPTVTLVVAAPTSDSDPLPTSSTESTADPLIPKAQSAQSKKLQKKSTKAAKKHS